MFNKLRKYLKEIYIIRTIERSGLFDKEYYLKNNLDVARSCMNPIRHYVRHGWKEGRKPSPSFDTKGYLNTYPDVEDSVMNPLYDCFCTENSKVKKGCVRELATIKKNKTAQKSNLTTISNVYKKNKYVSTRMKQDFTRGLISVIIPVYKTDSYLPYLLDSIARQTYNNVEIIIVDDGAFQHNELKKMIDEYRQNYDLSLFKLDKNMGANYARNYGFSKSRGEFLFFCDSDIILEDTIFEKMLQRLHENPSASWVYCNYFLGERELKFFHFNGNTLYSRNYCSTMSMIRFSVFPGFDDSIKRYQDWDLFLTIYENGGKGDWIDEFLFYAEDRHDGITKSDVVKDSEARAILKRKHDKVLLL